MFLDLSLTWCQNGLASSDVMVDCTPIKDNYDACHSDKCFPDNVVDVDQIK